MEKISRKDYILQCLAKMLETQPGARITTAALAREVGLANLSSQNLAKVIVWAILIPHSWIAKL